MKKALVILISLWTCTTFGQSNSEPYAIHFDVIEKNPGQIVLIIDMNLDEGSHFVSPHSSEGFSGRFGVQLQEGESVTLDGAFTESPRTVEIYDPHPFVNGKVNWVREDTRYEYPIRVDASGDFETKGMVRFTIEPHCTFEKIPFIIKRKAGKVVVELYGCKCHTLKPSER